MRAISSFLTFVLFFLPLLFVPVGFSYFELPKVFIAEISILVIFAYFLLRGNLNLLFENKQLLYPIMGIFALSIIDLIFFRTSVSLFGNSFRLQGIFLLWNLLLITLTSSSMSFKKMNPFFYFIPLLGLLITIFIFGTDGRGKYVGSLGEATALAATAAFIWPFVFLNIKQKPLKFLSILLAASIILLSGSRAGLIAFCIQLIVLSATTIFKRKLKTAVVLGVMFTLFALLTPFFDFPGTFENRGDIWKTAITSPYDHFRDGKFSPSAFLIGRGFGNVEFILPKLSTALDNNVRFQYIDSAHNIFLDWWMEGGLIGVGILFWLVFSTLKSFVRKNDKVMLLSFMGLLTILLFNPLSVVNLLQFWWLIGISFSNYEG